jgi:hypothetical protein
MTESADLLPPCPNCGASALYVRSADGDPIGGLAWAVVACLQCAYAVKVRPDPGRHDPAGGE